MLPLRLSSLVPLVNGNLIGQDCVVEQIVIDSRKPSKQSLFVALKGDRFDGHDFGKTAVNNGACALLVEHRLDVDIPQLVVADTQRALGSIAAHIRQSLTINAIAITGSNGKTSVKEMVAAILGQSHQVLYTAGNLNNEIGVPLTLLRLTPSHHFGVFELGANHLGEIAYTSSLVRPDIALVNNVGSAHLEGFGSLAGVAKAKAEIFKHLSADGVAIINADDDFAKELRQAAVNFKQLSFSIGGNDADVIASDLSVDAVGCYQFNLSYKNKVESVSLPLAGRHQVSNALAASSICLALGLSLDYISSGLASLVPVKGRMQPIKLGRILLIDDSYNANPASVEAAIDWLQTIKGHKCLVLGDLAEMGENTCLVHRQLGEYAKSHEIDNLFSLGDNSRYSSEAFSGCHFTKLDDLTNELIEYLNKLSTNITLLVKGSRSAAMERVVAALVIAFQRKELR